MSEPIIHSHITDVLPDDHPLANDDVECGACGALVHAHNNECMRTWLEFPSVNVCATCVGALPADLWVNWSKRTEWGDTSEDAWSMTE